jgi:hypothetical protein
MFIHFSSRVNRFDSKTKMNTNSLARLRPVTAQQNNIDARTVRVFESAHVFLAYFP